MIKRILLDLDDTCNSFTMHILGRLGLPVGPYDYDKFPDVGYDIVKAWHVLGGEPMTEVEFWESITREMWSTLPASPEFDRLFGLCRSLVGDENICILTSPTKDPDSLAGKLEWIHEQFPSWMHRQFLIGPTKHFCAHPEALLIDDNDEKVNKFRKHGGRALLVPRPWNSMKGRNTWGHIDSQFHYLMMEKFDGESAA